MPGDFGSGRCDKEERRLWTQRSWKPSGLLLRLRRVPAIPPPLFVMRGCEKNARRACSTCSGATRSYEAIDYDPDFVEDFLGQITAGLKGG